MTRENIEVGGWYDYHEDIHDMLNENFVFGVSENLDDVDIDEEREWTGKLKIISKEANKSLDNYCKSLETYYALQDYFT